MVVSRFDCPPPGRAEQITTRIAYLILGVGVSSWAALVPYAKARLSLDEAVLGMLLLCVGAGSLLAMPFTGLISGRFGCRKVILISGTVFLLTLPLLASVESIWMMALCLFLFGASIGMMDVSLTIQAVFVEQASGRAMMSGFHCLYSVGGICGAGGMALLLGFLSPYQAMLALCLSMLALLAAFGRHFLPYGSEGETPLFVIPRGIVLLIGVLCFIMYLSEGTILDWGALFMTAERGTEAARAGLAFACFSVAMAVGRLFGDRIVQAFGDARILLYGSLCAAAGFGLVVAAPWAWASLAGFTIVGIGVSNIVPVLFSATARQKFMPLSLAVSAVTTIGYLGVLAGPALMGFVAHATSLVVVFCITLALMCFVAFVSRVVP